MGVLYGQRKLLQTRGEHGAQVLLKARIPDVEPLQPGREGPDSDCKITVAAGQGEDSERVRQLHRLQLKGRDRKHRSCFCCDLRQRT